MTTITSTTIFPSSVFAALTPAPYLHAHLSSAPPTRPSSRSPSTPRTPNLNTSSLTHAHGSAVIRVGDTAIVAGVRAEILDARDAPTITDATAEHGSRRRRASEMMDVLLVPNVEFATGCDVNQVPGSAPSSVAQATAWRVKEMLVSLGFIQPEQLEIWGRRYISDARSSAGDDGSDQDDYDAMDDVVDENEEKEIVGYFTLYIDLVIISLSGPPFTALWAAAIAALRDTKLPAASYSVQVENIICSPLLSDSRLLATRGLPIAASYAVFESRLHKGLKDRKEESWVLADVDAEEEIVCKESVVVVVDCSDSGRGTRILRLEKRGGFVVDEVLMKDIIDMSAVRWEEWRSVIEAW